MKSKGFLKFILLGCLAFIAGWLVWLYLRSLPEIGASKLKIAPIESQNTPLAWPGYGESGLGAVGFGELGLTGAQTQLPTASIAKIITALAILQKKPLKSGEQGPVITLGPEDVKFFETHYVNGGSVVAVKNGEQITQYQALQAMLLPSGNNMAESLAKWAFGSQTAYADYANDMLKKMGIKNTVIADASGFSPGTISTALDLLEVGQKAMANPVLAGIVAQQSAVVPVAGEINNVNWLLGEDGVVGIKTGSTDQAGGNFLLAANRTIGNEKVTLIGAIMGAPTRNQAISDSRLLIRSADAGFEKNKLLNNEQVVGIYNLPWGGQVEAITKHGLEKLVWKNKETTYKVELSAVSAGTKGGDQVGRIIIKNAGQIFTVPVVLEKSISNPSLKWRFTRN